MIWKVTNSHMQEEKKAAAPKSPNHLGNKALGEKRHRKLGALAGKIRIASDFDETPPKVIASFEGA